MCQEIDYWVSDPRVVERGYQYLGGFVTHRDAHNVYNDGRSMCDQVCENYSRRDVKESVALSVGAHDGFSNDSVH